MSKDVATTETAPSAFALPKESALGDYALAQFGDSGEIAEIMRENLGGGALQRFDLDQIKVPAGESTTFEIPSIEGIESVKQVDGVIIHWMTARNYWRIGYDDSEGSTPPDCSSDDGVTGVGDPGGACQECPLAQMGSGDEGKGSACTENRVLFLLRPGHLIPSVVKVPTMSIGPNKKYMLGLAARAISYHKATTSITCHTEKNNAGKKYAELDFTLGAKLNGADLEMLSSYRADFLKVIETMKASALARGENASFGPADPPADPDDKADAPEDTSPAASD